MARMDELARRYLLLCLRLERLLPSFVDSYNGPPELRDAVAGEPAPLPPELHDEAMALRAVAADLLAGDEAAVRRGRWMDGQLRSIAVQSRQAGGEEIAYYDLLEQLYGIPIAPKPDEELLAARDRLDAALTGGGTLAVRLAAHNDALRIEPAQVIPAISASADRFRAAARRDFDLPEAEGIDWEATHDQPWGAYATFTGSGRTRIIINLDLPVTVSAAAYLASHEAYPGHHAEHAVKERTLIGRGVAEATMRTMNTPEAVLSEGQGDISREVVMSDRELEAELDAIGRQVGIRHDWHAAVLVQLATAGLSGVPGNAALMLHQQGRPEDDVRAWIGEVAPIDEARMDHLLRTIREPFASTYAFTYSEGTKLIRPWLETVGQTNGFWRLLSEQLSPAQLLAELEPSSGA